MSERDTRTEEKQDLTTSAYWDLEWDGTLDRRIKRWHARRGRKREGKAASLIDLLSRFLDESGTAPANVLEIGCAPGGILARFHQRRPGHSFHGLDYASDGLHETERFFSAIGMPAVLHCADLRQFRPHEQYSLVYSCGLIEHFSDPLPIVEHHARLCAPSGTVVVTVPNFSGAWQQWLMSRLDPEKLATHNLSVMKPELLGRIMAAAGLENVSTGAMGRGKFSVSCNVRNGWTGSLRMAAKTWNALHRVLPLAPGWHATYWAAGHTPGAAHAEARAA